MPLSTEKEKHNVSPNLPKGCWQVREPAPTVPEFLEIGRDADTQNMTNATIAARPNAELLEENYLKWKEDPGSVDAKWQAFFEGFEIGLAQVPLEEGGENGDRPVSGGTKALSIGGTKPREVTPSVPPGEGTAPLMVTGSGVPS